MPETTPAPADPASRGVGRLIRSSKFLSALVGIVAVVIAFYLPGLPPEAAAKIAAAIVGLIATFIGGTAYEDGKKEGN